MERQRIHEAAAEAKRFLDKADDYFGANAADRAYVGASKQGGALRRASLDLTRALAKMRNGSDSTK